IAEGVDHAVVAAPTDTAVADFRARHDVRGPYLLYVGVDRPHKNLARVVDAFVSVAGRIPHALVIIGHGHEGIAARAATAGVGDLRRRGIARAATFTWERAARRTLELYRSVLA